MMIGCYLQGIDYNVYVYFEEFIIFIVVSPIYKFLTVSFRTFRTTRIFLVLSSVCNEYLLHWQNLLQDLEC